MKRLYIYIMVMAAALSAMAQKQESHDAKVSRNLETFIDIYKQLDMFYVDSLDADTTMLWAIQSMLYQVDPFTSYYPQDDEVLRQMTTGKYAGIGSVIRWNKKEKRSMISEPFKGSPAQKAGLRAGDVILSIDGVDVYNKANSDVSEMLRGDAGTTFALKVQRRGVEKPLTFNLTRQTIQQPSVPYYGMLKDGIGYIYLSSFTEGAANEVSQALKDLLAQGMTELVFDLRENPGGSIMEAVNIVGMFVPKGSKVVDTKGKVASTNRTYSTTYEPLCPNLPMVVMVDGGSASASEIVSGCLQDRDRAVVIGLRTYGKGLVQSVLEDKYHGNLKITVSRYYIPSGRCIQAYDYRHKTADGAVGTVPDSLTKVFHTQNGREVRDGGGIKPDVEVRPDSLPTFIYDLVASDEFFDWTVDYNLKHGEMAPAGEFSLSDEDYADFSEFIVKSGFVANRRSEKVLSLLKDAMKAEGYYDDASAEMEALEAKLVGDLHRDLERNRESISRYLCDQVVVNRYYNEGSCKQQLVGDKCVEKALELLADKDEYKKILKK